MIKKSSKDKSALSQILKDFFNQRKKSPPFVDLESVKKEMKEANESFQSCIQTQKILDDVFEDLNHRK